MSTPTAPRPGRVELSVFTKPWRQRPLPELADLVAGLGFDGVELPVRPGFQVTPDNVGRDLPRAVKAFESSGLRVYSIAGSLEEEIIASCGDSGVPIIRIMAPIAAGAYLESEARLRRALVAASPAAVRHGVKVGVQQHYGDNISSAMGLRHLLEGLDKEATGAIWDAAHEALAGQEPEASLDIVGEFLLMVNLKNAFYLRVNGPESEQAAWTRHFTTGRHGLASWPRVAAELHRRTYQGVVCLTAEYTEEDRVDRLVAEDVVYARHVFEEAGRSRREAG